MKRCWLISILIKLVQNEDDDNKYKVNLSEEDSAQQRNSKESHWPSHDIPARGISTRATIATRLPVRLITFRYFWLVLEVDSSTFPRFFSFFFLKSHDFHVEKCESPNLSFFSPHLHISKRSKRRDGCHASAQLAPHHPRGAAPGGGLFEI